MTWRAMQRGRHRMRANITEREFMVKKIWAYLTPLSLCTAYIVGTTVTDGRDQNSRHGACLATQRG